MIWIALLSLLPWVLLGALLAFGVHEPRALPEIPSTSHTPRPLPTVAVVIPARNEARNIERCLASLSAQEYPDFSILVVDDRSTDDTAERARGMPRGRAREIRVLDGASLPEGWFGKPWACAQGAAATESELILFTDADTRHGPGLLRRAVEGLWEDGADALTIKGFQELGSFGERLVQPQIFALLAIRYRNLNRPIGPENAHDAIANGQYILVRRDVYEGIGGHEAVRGEVVEDLRLAQVLVAGGHRISMRLEEDGFSTRMYQSLREVVGGWTKNLAVGARQSSGRLAPLALAGILGFLLFFWIVPPLVFLGTGAAALFTGSSSGTLLAWSATVTIFSFLTWAAIYGRFEVSPAYATFYPAGAAIAAWIVLRSWRRGEGRIEWKGRRYVQGEVQGELPDESPGAAGDGRASGGDAA